MDPAAFSGPLRVVGTQGSVSTVDQGLGAAHGSAGLCLSALCTGLSRMELMDLQGFSQPEGKNGEFGCKSGCGKTQGSGLAMLLVALCCHPCNPCKEPSWGFCHLFVLSCCTCRAVAGTCGAEDQKLLERIGRHRAQPIHLPKTSAWL